MAENTLEKDFNDLPEHQKIVDAFKFKKFVSASDVIHLPRTEDAKNRPGIVYIPRYPREDGRKGGIVQIKKPRLGVMLLELRKSTYSQNKISHTSIH